MRRAAHYGDPLHRATGEAARIFADLASRDLRRDGGSIYVARTRRRALVVVAVDENADALEQVLLREGLEIQFDKPEHLDPERRAREPEAVPPTEGMRPSVA